MGTRPRLDPDDPGCNYSCPYGENCKHGVAVLIQYLDGGYVDCDEIMERVVEMDRDELLKVVEEFVRLNPGEFRV